MKTKSKRNTSDETQNGNLEKEKEIKKEIILKEEKKEIKSESTQPTIAAMFTKMQNKRKLEEESDIDQSKKPKINGTNSEKISCIRKTLPKKCSECRQLLDNPDLKLYPGDPEDAQEEFIMLTSPILSVHTDGEYESVDVDERLQHRITNFCVYDRNTHIVPFDEGLIEKNVEIYFSGYVKPIYEEDPGHHQGGVLARNLGPINEWYVTGFDGGSKALIGFGTAFAEYILMSPSELYAPYMIAVQEKIYLSKAVIETLSENNEATYEDLLNKLETTVPPQGISKFTEDSLIRHAQFIVDQVQSYDSAADEWDTILLVSPAIRALISLSGVTLGGNQKLKVTSRARVAKVKKAVHSLATTTPLVQSIFENFFTGQLEDKKSTAPRRKRCGVCEVCQLPDCGTCNFCRDMVKFGGSGRGKQACALRRCPNMAVQEAEEDDILADNLDDEMDKKALSSNSSSTKKSIAESKAEVSWVGNPINKIGPKEYYMQAKINDFTVRLGDYVMVKSFEPSTPMFIARIQLMFETSTGKKKYHALWFERGTDTVLGETSDPHEIFGSYDCDDKDLTCIHSKCEVIFKAPAPNWQDLGGTEESLYDCLEIEDEKSFFYQKWYDSDTCRFEDPPLFHDSVHDFQQGKIDCLGCLNAQEKEKMANVEICDKLEDDDINTYFKNAVWMGQRLQPGDCVYINPEAINLTKKKIIKKENEESNKEIDETMYPEAYRKSDYIKGSNLDVPEPFRIGYIVKIFQNKKKQIPKVIVKAFYRPEDTCRTSSLNHSSDLNLLFWSDEEYTVEFSNIQGKCYVVFSENLTETPDEYASRGPNRFHFNECYDSSTKTFDEPPSLAQRLGRIGKGKNNIKGKKKYSEDSKIESKPEEYPVISQKLRTLDVFSGCGGLSEGFHEAGISETLWAIEKEEPAAQAFRLNFPECSVFSEDCNLLLRLVIDGEESTYKGQSLPQKGEVEMICGGPPCQGFSGMNRFNSRQYSLFKNSLVVSYLSYCDYYRPRFFLLENVRNFVSFKRSMILKLTLRTLIRMGYQCTFAVLQAGQYGVPQTRRRAIILAAAPGEKLPKFPEPQHVFSPRASQLTVLVDDKKYKSNIRWSSSAPYRTITVGDSMSDLPEIHNGAKGEEISYNGEPISHFQRKLRGQVYQPVLRDHICKEMNPLVEARMRYIPTEPGADWRDLPNISIRLSDGTYSKLLKYTHDDIKVGRASNGSLRGVCSCASGEVCDPMDRQFGTLIPWCLPHTGNRHNHWAGLYGRLEWDGFFSTTITNPEPMGKQGRVLHPKQNRLVSVRECARSQGFPDSYNFFGTILDRHRQIGNAVPPPLSAAIGLEIKKCLAFKEALIEEENEA